MSNLRLIREDENGTYVNTGGYTFRPIPENRDSKLKAGDKVSATHIGGSPAARVGGEVWFSRELRQISPKVIANFLDTPGVLWHGDSGVTIKINGNHVKLTDWLRQL